MWVCVYGGPQGNTNESHKFNYVFAEYRTQKYTFGAEQQNRAIEYIDGAVKS